MALHSFEPEIADLVGVNAAVIFQNIKFWCEKNAANERHFHEGGYWTYNSTKAFDALFEYLSANQIRTAIEKLINADLITAGNFNSSAYDRTRWFCVSAEIHLGKNANGSAEKHQTIPDRKPVDKPDIKKPTKEMPNEIVLMNGFASQTDEFQALWFHNPKPVDKAKALKVWNRLRKKHSFRDLAEPALQYFDLRRGHDQHYTKVFFRWLQDERFLEDQTAGANTTMNTDQQLDALMNTDQQMNSLFPDGATLKLVGGK